MILRTNTGVAIDFIPTDNFKNCFFIPLESMKEIHLLYKKEDYEKNPLSEY